MKTILLPILIILLSINTFSQVNSTTNTEKFEYSEIGLNDFIITPIKEKTIDFIYDKTINWIKETYKNPDIVIKMQIENEKVRINSIARNLVKVKGYSMDLDYVLEISIKENKYKFEITSLLYDGKTDYKKLPNFKTDTKLLENFGNSAINIENYFNSLNENLKNYILGNTNDNDW